MSTWIGRCQEIDYMLLCKRGSLRKTRESHSFKTQKAYIYDAAMSAENSQLTLAASSTAQIEMCLEAPSSLPRILLTEASPWRCRRTLAEHRVYILQRLKIQSRVWQPSAWIRPPEMLFGYPYGFRGPGILIRILCKSLVNEFLQEMIQMDDPNVLLKTSERKKPNRYRI